MDHVRIAIVGAGFSGLGMAVALKREGIHDFTILERADDVGGAWRDNTYPGCACDVPSHLYSFSFQANPDWSESFSPQAEIHEYIQRCTDDHGVREHIRLGCEVTGAAWDDDESRWTIETSDGTITADLFVQGTGPFSEPALPHVPGIDEFEGDAFHSAQWGSRGDMAGKRVAVVGTGASAVQIVPSLQKTAEGVYLFQRTPPWVMPRAQRKLTSFERKLYRRVPLAQRIARAAIYLWRETYVIGLTHPTVMRFIEIGGRLYIRTQIRNRELRRKVRPSYRLGCKRMLMSNEYYHSLDQPNVEVVTDGVRELRERSVVSSDGAEREVDAVVFATGFHLTDPPLVDKIRGRGGVLLGERWKSEGMQSLRGTAVPGFPNYFLIVGPNTGIGHTSLLFMIESQLGYILDALKAMEARGAKTVEAREEAEDRYNRRLQERMQGTVWLAGGCTSHYFDANGRNTALWPGFTFLYRRELKRFDPSEYVLAGDYAGAAGNGSGTSEPVSSSAGMAWRSRSGSRG